jgi:hypothetical protein
MPALPPSRARLTPQRVGRRPDQTTLQACHERRANGMITVPNSSVPVLAAAHNWRFCSGFSGSGTSSSLLGTTR